jgi:GxxExxY protein
VEADLQREKANELSNRVIGAAIEVHRHLGPGLLESAYQHCLRHELELLGIPFESEQKLPIEYKGKTIEGSYRLDIIVDHLVIVETKSVEKLEPIHQAQLLTYLRLTGIWLGLLINFNVKVLKGGVKRLVSG